jgi:hypothetical protein
MDDWERTKRKRRLEEIAPVEEQRMDDWEQGYMNWWAKQLSICDPSRRINRLAPSFFVGWWYLIIKDNLKSKKLSGEVVAATVLDPEQRALIVTVDLTMMEVIVATLLELLIWVWVVG